MIITQKSSTVYGDEMTDNLIKHHDIKNPTRQITTALDAGYCVSYFKGPGAAVDPTEYLIKWKGGRCKTRLFHSDTGDRELDYCPLCESGSCSKPCIKADSHV